MQHEIWKYRDLVAELDAEAECIDLILNSLDLEDRESKLIEAVEKVVPSQTQSKTKILQELPKLIQVKQQELKDLSSQEKHFNDENEYIRKKISAAMTGISVKESEIKRKKALKPA